MMPETKKPELSQNAKAQAALTQAGYAASTLSVMQSCGKPEGAESKLAKLYESGDVGGVKAVVAEFNEAFKATDEADESNTSPEPDKATEVSE